MKRVKNGYAFISATTSSDVGIKEEFKVVGIDNTLKVDALFGVDVEKKPVKPAVLRQRDFVSVEELVKGGESIDSALDTFIRSNKAVYSVLRSMVMLCKVSGKYNVETDTWSDDTRVNFYSPRTVGKGESGDYVICSEITMVSGIDTVVVSEKVFNDFKESVLKYLSMCIGDRTLFVGTRSNLFD